MEKSALPVFILLFLGHWVFSQEKPEGSLYLGQTPPGGIPKRFELSVNPGSFSAERIAISNDGTEIFYSEVKSYYPASGDTIKYYRYSGRKWRGPYNLFPGFLSPVLSASGDTIFFQTAGSAYETFMAVKKGKAWSRPQRILKNFNSAHYLQVTGKGNAYISSKSQNRIGGNDWCRLILENSDTVALSLGRPLNTEWDDLDFYIAGDESYILVATITGLAVSYPKPGGGWTSPRNLGKDINFGLASWGPFVTPDKKYLFYTTGTKPDYSDTGIFWVRVDNLIDSLEHTNNVPYLQRKLENQTGSAGHLIDFSIPGDSFLDDDGETRFTYSAMLNTGQALPSWLSFDCITGRFSGVTVEPAEYTILLIADDKHNASVPGLFKLTIRQ